MIPSHGEHLQLHKGHLLVAQGHHQELSRIHKAIAKHTETADPKLSRLHTKLSEIHEDHAEHCRRCADAFGDGVEARLDTGEQLQRLAKVLGGE